MVPTIIGLALCLAVGGGCRYFDIPSPAPPRVIGAGLLLAMTLGVVIADTIMGPGHTLTAQVTP
jgi:XapX domain-containing protein